jgi:16S rRNA (guanine966-N2)-methyltransferase
VTRIIAGRAKGRRLHVPTQGTRPTSDRVREALFASLDAQLLASGRQWDEIVVLDLCAGSGALGLEAWSRGAESVTSVERDRKACEVIRSNARQCDADVTVVCADIESYQPHSLVDMCLLDPPYAWESPRIARLLDALCEQGVFSEGSTIVVERGKGHEAPFPPSITLDHERQYGDTVLWYGHVHQAKGGS